MQSVWTAVVGPWILWKIRKVDDVHSWAWQTRLAIVAGYQTPTIAYPIQNNFNSCYSLPGTPLWMAFTYSKLSAMQSINLYFPPAGWYVQFRFFHREADWEWHLCFVTVSFNLSRLCS
jgi:hypothetical protein